MILFVSLNINMSTEIRDDKSRKIKDAIFSFIEFIIEDPNNSHLVPALLNHLALFPLAESADAAFQTNEKWTAQEIEEYFLTLLEFLSQRDPSDQLDVYYSNLLFVFSEVETQNEAAIRICLTTPVTNNTFEIFLTHVDMIAQQNSDYAATLTAQFCLHAIKQRQLGISKKVIKHALSEFGFSLQLKTAFIREFRKEIKVGWLKLSAVMGEALTGRSTVNELLEVIDCLEAKPFINIGDGEEDVVNLGAKYPSEVFVFRQKPVHSEPRVEPWEEFL
jgi:hypothetical protein